MMGDGNRVKATLNGATTVYIGNYYEQTGRVTTTYYYAGSVRVALRQGITVSYLLGDHLGSTAVTANGSGGFSSELRYKPWGETRYRTGTPPTRHQFTGQITDTEIGLYFYGARMYSPSIMLFISADTIVPDPTNPQTLNRYAYALNNPVKYTDPTGHDVDCGIGDSADCRSRAADEILQQWGYDVPPAWDQLTSYEQKALTRLRYNESDWNGTREDALNGGATDVAGTFGDPLTYVELALGARAGIKIAQLGWEALNSLGRAAAGACAANEVCRNEVSAGVNSLQRLLGDCSFSADTLVATKDGERAISTLKVGEHVLAYDPLARANGYYTITAVLAHTDLVIEFVTIDGERIETTPEHPLDFGLLVEGIEKRKPSELQCWLRDHTGSGGFRDQA